MEIAGLTVFILLSLLGFILIFFNTSGTGLIFLGAFVYGALTSFATVTPRLLILLFVLFLMGEALDYFLVMLGAKKFGASNRAILGAFFGGFAGAFIGAFFFGIGVLFGTFLGIFGGAFLFEYLGNKTFQQSLRSGTGSLIGAVASIFVKSLLGLVMVTLILARLFIHNYS